MQIPLFYGSTRKKMQLIQLDIAQRNNEKDYILNNLTNQYKQLVAAYQTALNDYQMYEDHLLNQLKLMKEQATILFATGEISMIEFLQTKQQCVDLELNYLETIKTVNEAIYQLNWFVTQ
jgi:cobalt-zinc-cadmium resistance protein CzcA